MNVYRAEPFSYLDTTGANLNAIERTVEMEQSIPAPVSKGDPVGAVVYTLEGNEIGRTDILAAEDIEEASFMDYLKMLHNTSLYKNLPCPSWRDRL